MFFFNSSVGYGVNSYCSHFCWCFTFYELVLRFLYWITQPRTFIVVSPRMETLANNNNLLLFALFVSATIDHTNLHSYTKLKRAFDVLNWVLLNVIVVVVVSVNHLGMEVGFDLLVWFMAGFLIVLFIHKSRLIGNVYLKMSFKNY